MCNTIINLHNGDQNFIPSILFTDETGFGHDNPINLHNKHYWSDENPHGIIERRFQTSFRLMRGRVL